MTDNEIMTLDKALFILRHGSAEGKRKYFEAIKIIENEVNRQKAEIERLKADCKKHYFVSSRGCGKTGAITERIICIEDRAIKYFAERLCEDRVSNDPVVIATRRVLKEMVGDNGG